MLSVAVTLTIMLTSNPDLSLNPKLIFWGIKVATLDKDSLFFPSSYVLSLIFP